MWQFVSYPMQYCWILLRAELWRYLVVSLGDYFDFISAELAEGVILSRQMIFSTRYILEQDSYSNSLYVAF